MNFRVIVLLNLIGFSIALQAKQKDSAQDLALFRVSHQTCQGIQGGFFSGAAGYIWKDMATKASNSTHLGRAAVVGTGIVTGFFGNWFRASRQYAERKTEKMIPAGKVERVDNAIFGACTGAIAGNLLTRYAMAKQMLKSCNAPRYGALVGTALGFLWNVVK